MKFSTEWFDITRPVWQELFDRVKPTSYLEIGSFEGASACFAIEHIGKRGEGTVECIDPFDEDYPETVTNFDHDMRDVHLLFMANVSEAKDTADNPIDFYHHREPSFKVLVDMISDEDEQFDCVYIDGDHHTKGVLSDCILAFQMLRSGGLMILDDYLWAPHIGASPLESPKFAIDTFTTIYHDELHEFRGAPLWQRYFTKG